MISLLKLYAAAILVFCTLDFTWLGFVARGFYRAQLGHLMRADVKLGPAIAFYLIYVAAVVVLCVQPALERRSLLRALELGGLFGLAAYAAFDLTSLALLKDFPTTVALVDLAWGTVLTGSVASLAYLVGSKLGA